MSERRPRASWLLLSIAFAVFIAAIQACGNGGTPSGFDDGSGDAGSSGSSGSSSGASGNVFGDGGGTAGHVLAITPASAAVTITDKTKPVLQAFAATLDGAPLTTQVTWSLDTYAQGDITNAGAFSTTGIVGGPVAVSVTWGKL
jgi:hypothetical protein